ncbi:Short-chain dehydrogenase/reductase SDR [Caballeronia calidae]|uniref:Short-chain dehydrogenase/reductase SDR n=1 Tax=Caballeronia calidae TaxID=1777139 RepID=A0A158EF07_9BURK|nr:SDR family oxidoreductase [Caballeronia calidae]SAL05455.1 Short-chain dehydrogenase/reductase SDR [Caballeronia calidae]
MELASMFSLEGRVALVTGGNAGIGLEIASALGRAGARVVIAARREGALRDAAATLAAQGIGAGFIVADVSSPQAAIRCAEEALEQHGRVDILVNAAGVNLRQPFAEVTPETWQTQLALHLGAPFFLTQKLAPLMRAHGWGRVINIASLQSYRAFANSAPYGAGKGGVVQLTRAIAQEWGRHGITCNAIGPGFFPTALTASVFADEALASKHADQTCIGRNGKLEDIDGLAVFLASDASSYISGQTIMVDGGYTAR